MFASIAPARAAAGNACFLCFDACAKRQGSRVTDDARDQDAQLHLRLTASAPRTPCIYAATVVNKQRLSPTVMQLVLDIDGMNRRGAGKSSGENADLPLIEYRAGQWVDMYIPDEPVVGGFSIVSAPYETRQNGCLQLAVKYSEHPPARWCHNLSEVGSEVQVRVGGDLWFSPEKKHVTEKSKQAAASAAAAAANRPVSLLLIAGGVGINPIISMYKHFVHLKLAEQCTSCAKESRPALLSSRSDEAVVPKMHRLYLLYSAQTPDELIFHHDVEKGRSLCYPDVDCSYFCTRLPLTSDAMPNVTLPTGTIDNIHHERLGSGDVERALEFLTAPHRHSASDAEILCYVCGPQVFNEDMLKVVSKYPSAIKPTNVKHEKWY